MRTFRDAILHIKTFPSAFWVVIGSVLISQLGNMAFVFLVVYATSYLGLSLMQGSLAFAVFSSSMLLGGLFAGNLIDHIGSARIMVSSVFLTGIVLLIFPFIHNFYLMVLLCLLWGSFYGIYRPASQAFITQLSTPGLHKITFSVYRLAMNLGMSVGPAIGGYVAVKSFKAIFIFNGLANIIAAVILLFGLFSLISIKFYPSADHKKMISIKWLKYDSALRLFVMGLIPSSMVFFQHESTLPVFLQQHLNLPLSFYGWLFTINTLMIVFFELPLNLATINWSYRVNFMLGAFFIAIGFTGLCFASRSWHVVVLAMLWTLGEMILYPSASSYIADIAPEQHRGSYMGMYSTCSNLGMLLGPAGGAVIMQHFGGHALWLSCGLCGIISIVIFARLIEPYHKK